MILVFPRFTRLQPVLYGVEITNPQSSCDTIVVLPHVPAHKTIRLYWNFRPAMYGCRLWLICCCFRKPNSARSSAPNVACLLPCFIFFYNIYFLFTHRPPTAGPPHRFPTAFTRFGCSNSVLWLCVLRKGRAAWERAENVGLFYGEINGGFLMACLCTRWSR